MSDVDPTLKPVDEVEVENDIKFQGDSIRSMVLRSTIDYDWRIDRMNLFEYYAVYVDLMKLNDVEKMMYVIRFFDRSKKIIKQIALNYDSIANIEVDYIIK